MSNLVKKNTGLMTEWDPFRAMRDLLRWDPFREMAPAFPTAPAWEPATFTPDFDVTENKDGYLFKADVPGMKPEDIEIAMSNNRLQISGKRDYEQETKNDTVYAYERQYGSFSRTFTLPEGADVEHTTCELKDGVLTLVIAKKVTATTKKVPISTGATKS